jgi:ERCC4-type nuclease
MDIKDIKAIKESIVIICDSREQKNQHLLCELNTLGIKFKIKALKFADYSFEVDGKSFENICVVERKAHLTELSSNFCSGRMRFAKEFEKAKLAGAKVTLIIEDANGKAKMLKRRELDADPTLTGEQKQKGTWRSAFPALAMINSLSSWKERYNLTIQFVDKKDTASCMLTAFYLEIEKYFGKDGVVDG